MDVIRDLWEKIKSLFLFLLNQLLNLIYKGIDWLFANMHLTERQSFVVSTAIYLLCMTANTCLIYNVAPFDQLKEPWAVMILIGAPVLAMYPFSDRMIAMRFELELQDVMDMSYSKKALYLSFIIYGYLAVVLEVIGTITVVLWKFMMRLMLSIWYWIFCQDKNLDDILLIWKAADSIAVTFDKIVSIVDKVMEKLIEIELYICDVSVMKACSKRKSAASTQNIILPPIITKKSKSEEELLPKVQAGDASAMIELGELYLFQCKDKEAVKMFIQAQKSGSANAYLHLAECFSLGDGLPKDEKAASICLKKCVELKDPEGTFKCGEHYRYGDIKTEQSIEISLKLYQRAAALGWKEAVIAIGIDYFEGKYVEQNYDKAFQCLNDIISESNEYGYWSYGGYYLAYCYLYGLGTEMNRDMAFAILMRKVEELHGGARYTDSCRLLGKCYREGWGTYRDIERAQYYEKKGNYNDRLLDEIAAGIPT